MSDDYEEAVTVAKLRLHQKREAEHYQLGYSVGLAAGLEAAAKVCAERAKDWAMRSRLALAQISKTGVGNPMYADAMKDLSIELQRDITAIRALQEPK